MIIYLVDNDYVCNYISQQRAPWLVANCVIQYVASVRMRLSVPVLVQSCSCWVLLKSSV